MSFIIEQTPRKIDFEMNFDKHTLTDFLNLKFLGQFIADLIECSIGLPFQKQLIMKKKGKWKTH